jgi:iron complex transport system permease protein
VFKKYKKTRNLLLILLPILGAVICLGIGRIYISPWEIVKSLYSIVTQGAQSVAPQTFSVLINVRLPRILLALICGAGLSVSGAAFQSIFANALATPDTLGVAAGSSFGAALALFLGAGLFVTQLIGLAAGLAAVLLTYVISRRQGVLSIIMLVLTGLVVSALFEAGISILKFMADPNAKLPAITFWLMGSLANISYRSLLLACPFIISGIVILFVLRWRLNILALNEDEAKAMGVNLKLMRVIVALGATMITAACVSLCGQVGWVGLLIPHVCRMLFGNNNRDVIPASISLGAIFLLVIDTVARAATAAEIPISILTAIIGAPLFIILLRKTGGVNL